ncbi:MAG: efflux transporter outer membrane subunit, partial [Massilia sp.]
MKLKRYSLLLSLALAACAHIPSDPHQVAVNDFAGAQYAASIHLARDGWPDARWWTRYQDPQLDALVERALRDSPTLAVAAQRVAGANAALAVSSSAGGASTSLAAGLNRQRYSGNGLFPEPIGGNFFNDASVQVKAGYDFDWWGKHRAEVAASLGEVNARLAERAQAERTLAAAVAQSYFHWQFLSARAQATRALAALQEELVGERRQRVARGLANIDEQKIAERDLGALREQALGLDAQAAREREALRALVGDSAGSALELQARPVNAGVASLPSRLGMDLLARRPDLQAARWRIEAMLGRVAASQAAFYPDINLAGAFGLDAVSLGRLLRPNSRTMLLGSAIELPLFDSRRLSADLGVARVERDAAIADYNAAVARAVGEVAEEGATLQGLEHEAAAHQATRASSAELVATNTRRMQAGLADRGAVLLARQSLLRQDDIGLQQQDAALQTEVALIRALGGGYQTSTATATATAALPANKIN